jgi:hypothetical protein
MSTIIVKLFCSFISVKFLSSSILCCVFVFKVFQNHKIILIGLKTYMFVFPREMYHFHIIWCNRNIKKRVPVSLVGWDIALYVQESGFKPGHSTYSPSSMEFLATRLLDQKNIKKGKGWNNHIFYGVLFWFKVEKSENERSEVRWYSTNDRYSSPLNIWLGFNHESANFLS